MMVKGELKSLRITLEATDTGVLGYVYLHEIAPGQSDHTIEVFPSVVADYSADDELLGVEFLNAEIADSTIMHQLAEQLDAPELAGINLAEICQNRA